MKPVGQVAEPRLTKSPWLSTTTCVRQRPLSWRRTHGGGGWPGRRRPHAVLAHEPEERREEAPTLVARRAPPAGARIV